VEKDPLRILIVTPYLPHSRIGMAGGLLIRDMIRYLARKHRVSLLSMVSQGEDKYVSELEQICDRVETVKFLRIYGATTREKLVLVWDRTMKFISSLCSSTPYFVKKYWSPQFAACLENITNEEAFDIVQLEFTQFAQYRPFIKAKAVILDEHDVSFVPRFREYRLTRSPFKRFYRNMEWLKCMNFEISIGEQFNQIFVRSENDRNVLKTFNPKLNTSILLHGVGLENISPINVEIEEESVAFMGSYSHRPNVDAVIYFKDHIVPVIEKIKPNIKIYLIGKNEEFLPRLPDNFVITGFCEDLAAILGKCQIFVAPLTWGGGVKVKLLHAMALGRPVVTTPVGAEGLDVEHGVHLLIAKNPEEFARYVIDLLDNPQLRHRIAHAGLEKVRERYGWERIIADIENLYYSLLID